MLKKQYKALPRFFSVFAFYYDYLQVDKYALYRTCLYLVGNIYESLETICELF